MTTLISVHSSDGCEGRCDARCYEATHPDCKCICHGVNHGVGLSRAVDNTRQLAEDWVADFAAQHPEANGQLSLPKMEVV
jgi:hypothetical protein